MVYIVKRRNYAKYLVFLFIIAIVFYVANDSFMPYILNDEIGYWSNAAFFSGYDWSSIANSIGYYSYGYSIILAPVLYFTKNPMLSYQIAIILNGVFLACGFLGLCKISEKLFKRENSHFDILLCFIISIFSNNLLQLKFAWTETLLYFLFILICLLAIDIIQNPTVVKLCFIIVTAVFSYMVHQRCLGVLIAVILLIFILRAIKRISLKQLCVCLLIGIILICIQIILKKAIISSVLLNSGAAGGNDYAGQISKVLYIFSLEGFVKFILSFFGKIFYLAISTGLLFFIAIEECVGSLLLGIHKCKEIKLSNKNVFYIFIMLATASTVGISTIFMIQPARLDHFVYGRYNEFIIGPLLLIALNAVLKYRESFRRYLIYGGILLILGVSVFIGIPFLNVQDFFPACSVGLSIYMYGDHLVIWSAVAGAILICFLMFKGLHYRKNRVRITTLVAVGTLWIMSAVRAFNMIDLNIRDRESLVAIASAVRQIQEMDHSNEVVRLIQGKDWVGNYYGGYLQFLLYDQSLEYVSFEELQGSDMEGTLLISPMDIEILDLVENSIDFEPVCIMDKYVLLAKAGLKVDKIKQEWIPVEVETMRSEINISNFKNKLKSNGVSGYLMYGPYLDMYTGSYELKVSGKIKDNNEIPDDLGFIEVSKGNDELGAHQISQSDIVSNGTFEIEIPFVIDKSITEVEFRVYTYENVFLEIDNICYRYIAAE